MTDDLRRLAEAATPGPWTHRGPYIRYRNDSQVLADNQGGGSEPVRVNTTGRAGSWEPDAAYIAAANPQAILALLDDLQRARSLHFAVGQDLDEDQAALQAAERRVAALEEGLAGLDEPLQWLNAHYHKAFVEMPTYIYRRIDKARALLAAAPSEPRHGPEWHGPNVSEVQHCPVCGPDDLGVPGGEFIVRRITSTGGER